MKCKIIVVRSCSDCWLYWPQSSSVESLRQDNKFIVSTGNTDGRLGALSRRPSTGKVETETADDFVLNQTTVISGATITGLICPATSLTNITNVEVEFYHVFPRDSANPDPLGETCLVELTHLQTSKLTPRPAMGTWGPSALPYAS